MIKVEHIKGLALVSLDDTRLDLRLSQALRPMFQAVLDGSPSGLLLELSSVRVIDFAGVAFLAELASLTLPDRIFALVAVRGDVQAALTKAALGRVLIQHACVQDALWAEVGGALRMRDRLCPVACVPMRPTTGRAYASLVEGAAPLLGNSILVHGVKHLRSNGFRRVHIATAYQHEVLSETLKDGAQLGVMLEVHPQRLLGNGQPKAYLPTAAQMVGDIRGRSLDPDEDLMVVPSNLATDADLSALHAAHKTSDAEVTLLCWSHQPVRPTQKTVVVDGAGLVATGQTERLSRPTHARAVAATGIVILSPAALDMLPRGGPSDLIDDFLPLLVRLGAKCKVVTAPARTYPVETFEDLRALSTHRLFLGHFGPAEMRRHRSGFIHPQAKVSRRAQLDGPVWIGPNVDLEASASLMGPVILHEGVHVGSGASLHRTLALPAARVAKGFNSEGAVLGARGLIVPEPEVEQQPSTHVAPVLPAPDALWHTVGQHVAARRNRKAS
ncbi:MAG: sugar phosphate nucleotidyltransferase [Pseudomonadota bacterium]